MIPSLGQVKCISLAVGLAMLGNGFHASNRAIMPVPHVLVDHGSNAWFQSANNNCKIGPHAISNEWCMQGRALREAKSTTKNLEAAREKILADDKLADSKRDALRRLIKEGTNLVDEIEVSYLLLIPRYRVCTYFLYFTPRSVDLAAQLYLIPLTCIVVGYRTPLSTAPA